MRQLTLARAALIAAGLWAGVAYARPPHGEFMGSAPMGDMMMGDGPGMMLPLIMNRSDLTADQREQIHKIMDADHQTLRTLFKQLETAHTALADKLFAPGPLQPADLTPLVQHVMQARQQLMEQGVKTTLAIRGVLTPEQLAKTAQLKDQLQKLRAQMHTLLEGDQ